VTSEPLMGSNAAGIILHRKKMSQKLNFKF